MDSMAVGNLILEDKGHIIVDLIADFESMTTRIQNPKKAHPKTLVSLVRARTKFLI